MAAGERNWRLSTPQRRIPSDAKFRRKARHNMVSLGPALVESSLSLGQEKYAMRDAEGQIVGESNLTQIATQRWLPVTQVPATGL